jgi:hypothetical protein
MKRLLVLLAALAALAAIVAGSALAGNSAGVSATPNQTVKMTSWTCTANFNRSASGIVNETNRQDASGCTGIPGGSSTLVQFRPTTAPDGHSAPQADPTCPATASGMPLFDGTMQYVNPDPVLAGSATSGYFLPGVTYNVCIYLPAA